MQHNPPRDIFNAKKIILKLDLFMQSLKKIGKEMPKIVSKNPIYNVNQCHNSVLICRNLSICNPRTLLPNINSHSKFEENWLKKLPAENENYALTNVRTDRRRDGH